MPWRVTRLKRSEQGCTNLAFQREARVYFRLKAFQGFRIFREMCERCHEPCVDPFVPEFQLAHLGEIRLFDPAATYFSSYCPNCERSEPVMVIAAFGGDSASCWLNYCTHYK